MIKLDLLVYSGLYSIVWYLTKQLYILPLGWEYPLVPLHLHLQLSASPWKGWRKYVSYSISVIQCQSVNQST